MGKNSKKVEKSALNDSINFFFLIITYTSAIHVKLFPSAFSCSNWLLMALMDVLCTG